MSYFTFNFDDGDVAVLQRGEIREIHDGEIVADPQVGHRYQAFGAADDEYYMGMVASVHGESPTNCFVSSLEYKIQRLFFLLFF